MKKYFRNLYYSLPVKLRFLLRRTFYLPIDFIKKERFNGITLPPKGKIYTGGGDFLKQGLLHKDYLCRYAGLKENSKVLDVGSGIGRSAIGLTTFLNKYGEYYGFDIVKDGVDWCSKNISSKFPNFHFKYINILNDLYSDDGIKSTNFTFPYNDGKFDVVFLISVFTHLQVEDISHYLSEINRVLKPDGKCLATFFIYDEKIQTKISKPEYYFSFQYDYGNYKLMNNKVKNANIALSIDLLTELADKNSLNIAQIINGFWSEEYEITDNDFQDIVVFSKK